MGGEMDFVRRMSQIWAPLGSHEHPDFDLPWGRHSSIVRVGADVFIRLLHEAVHRNKSWHTTARESPDKSRSYAEREHPRPKRHAYGRLVLNSKDSKQGERKLELSWGQNYGPNRELNPGPRADLA